MDCLEGITETPHCVLKDPHGWDGRSSKSVTCMAALDEVVVTGSSNGLIRVMHMDTPM